MAKYYDIYTQIPYIKPCPQVWIVESHAPYKLVDFDNGLMHVENIVGTTAKELWSTKALVCREEYFVCMVEAQFGSDDE